MAGCGDAPDCSTPDVIVTTVPILGSREFPTVIVDAGVTGSNVHARVTGSNANATLLLSASEGRTHASIYNHVNASLFLGFGFQPTLTLFDVKLTSGSYFEFPKPIYEGPVYGAWDAPGGFALVLELGKPGG